MDQIIKRLVDVYPLIMREFHRINAGYSKDLDLPIVQIKVLFMISSAGSCALSHVSNALDITPGWASETVDKLVRMGLLERDHGIKDRRKVRITLSKKGIQFLDDVKIKTKEYFSRVLELLGNKEDKKKLLTGFENLYEIAEVLAKKRKAKEGKDVKDD